MRTRLFAALALPLVLLVPRPAAADLLVSSVFTAEVLRYDGSTGAFLGSFVERFNGLDFPYGLAFGPDGNLYVSSSFGSAVLRYDGRTGAFLDSFADSGGLSFPIGLTFGPDGNLYVTDLVPGQVLRYDGSTGAFLDAFVPAGSGRLDRAEGLTFGPDGNLYVSSPFNDQVLRYDGSTGAFLDAFVSAGSGGLDFPFGLTFGPDGNLYVTSNDQVLRYDGSTGGVPRRLRLPGQRRAGRAHVPNLHSGAYPRTRHARAARPRPRGSRLYATTRSTKRTRIYAPQQGGLDEDIRNSFGVAPHLWRGARARLGVCLGDNLSADRPRHVGRLA
jgi:streptogramin lyase